jgi:hypothetical protein
VQVNETQQSPNSSVSGTEIIDRNLPKFLGQLYFVTRPTFGKCHYCPVPLSEILCGDPEALSVMVTAAVRAPVVAGVK